MTVSATFLETIVELAAPLGAITTRRMFGGAGVYADGQIFALLHEDNAYFKVDAETRQRFEAEGAGPFEYPTKTSVQVLATYHRVPDRLLDDADEFAAWARLALAASLRGAREKRAGQRSKGRSD